MRIAMIGQKGIPCTGGGIERHVEDLSRHLVKTGYDVTVYTRPHYTSPRRKTFHGVRLISLPSLTTKHLDAITHSLIATLHAMMSGYDIIHYHGVGPALCSWLPRLMTRRVRVVGTYHCDDWKQEKWGSAAKAILRLGAWMIIRVPHHTIAVSHEIYESLKTAIGSRASYIPTGVTLHARRPSRTILSQFGIGNSPYILVAARFVRHKSIHDAIEAFKFLKAKSRSSVIRKLKLVLAGGDSFTDEYCKELKIMAAPQPDIMFVGYQSGAALEALFAHAVLFLQPSSMEGRSIALLEAMAWGTPVAAADIKESRELLKHQGHEYGMLFPLHDLRQIASIMRAAIAQPAEMKRMASDAQRYVVSKYDWRTIIPLLDDLYVRLAAPRAPEKNLSFALER